MANRYFVTGTDTEVGKTAITACLAESARARGLSVKALKPVASGVVPGTWGDDATLLAAAGGHDPLVRVRLEAPLSPHRAAMLEGADVRLADLRAWIDGFRADVVLVEGVGGWLVPLGDGFVADLAGGDPVVLVAADRLGVLNHTLLTARAIGPALRGVVLNRIPGGEGPSRAYNLDDLRSLLSVPVVPAPPFDPTDPSARRDVGDLVWSAIEGR